MTDARLRLVVVGIGEVTTSAISFDAMIKMVDEVAKAAGTEPNEQNLSGFFNYEDFKNFNPGCRYW